MYRHGRVVKCNVACAQMLLKVNVMKTTLMTIGDVQADTIIVIRVNNDPVEKVPNLEY